MKLKNVVFIRFLMIFINILSLIIFIKGIGFAEPGMKITSPLNGATVNPGQEITVTIEAVEGFVVEEGIANIAGSPRNERITALPTTFTDKVPMKAIGEIFVSVSGRDTSGNLAMDDITLKVQQTATLQSLEIVQDGIHIYLDWNDNIKDDYDHYIGSIYGIYSDGIKRDITHAGTTYVSSDPSVISIDGEGKFQVYKVGEATIIVSNSGVSKVIPVVFEKPRGIRPSETIPPTTSIDIQPPANAAGWHNQNITITITAQDNEGGSGVQYIDYRFPRLQGEYEYRRDNRVIVPFSQEGEYEFWYCATDNEANREDVHSTTIHLDKTPPQTTITTPANQAEYLLNQVVTANWTVIDSLSGVESSSATTPSGQAIDTAQAGAKDFKVSCQDKAGNTATSTVKYYIRYRYLGILAPLKADGTSVFKLGRTVPFKFQLQDAHNSYVTTAQARIYLAKISNNVAGQEVEAVSTSQTTTGNLFRYDSQDNLYIFNLSTNSLTSGTWQARIELDDGTSKYVNFGLR